MISFFSLYFQLPSQLRDAFSPAADGGGIRTMLNRSMPASPYPTSGALLLGEYPTSFDLCVICMMQLPCATLQFAQGKCFGFCFYFSPLLIE